MIGTSESITSLLSTRCHKRLLDFVVLKAAIQYNCNGAAVFVGCYTWLLQAIAEPADTPQLLQRLLLQHACCKVA